MISVEWNATLGAVSLFLDDAGIDVLKQRLDELRKHQDHEHMRLGDELSDTGRMDAVFAEIVLEFCPVEPLTVARTSIVEVS